VTLVLRVGDLRRWVDAGFGSVFRSPNGIQVVSSTYVLQLQSYDI
jgi:hypothetical protein